ncbi:MAG: signal peptidase I [Promethearchaeota archaeon]
MSINYEQKFYRITSTSMYPTLNIGDIVILGKKAPKDIKTGENNGDILILKGPQYFYNHGIDRMMLNDLSNDIPIIHRAVDKKKKDNTWYFKTKGDNSWIPDGSFIIKEKTNDYILAEYDSAKTLYVPESEVLGVVLRIIPSTNDNFQLRSSSKSLLDINMFEKLEIKAYLKKKNIYKS